MSFKFCVYSRVIGEDETISGKERMKLLHLKTRFRMSKDSVPLFSQPKARKLSRDLKVSKLFVVYSVVSSYFYFISLDRLHDIYVYIDCFSLAHHLIFFRNDFENIVLY